MVQSIQATILLNRNSPSLVLRLVSKNVAMNVLVFVLPQLGRIKPDAAFAYTRAVWLPACRSTVSKAGALPAYKDSSYRALPSI